MLYTVTCNPALDCRVRLPRLLPGELNRVEKTTLAPGGKGINVALVLVALGLPARALGFTAGDTGRMLEQMVTERGVETAFIRLPRGSTRLNVKVTAEKETECNGTGPKVDSALLPLLEEQLAAAGAGDVVCLCGSLPPGLAADTYARLLVGLTDRGVYTVVDTAGAPLAAALPARPWLVKPNRAELEELLGVSLTTLPDVAEAASFLQRRGARQVLVSLGGEGALLCTEEGRRWYLPAPAGAVRGTVGAGDSMVAGFLAGWLSDGSATAALRMGVACGSATAFAGRLTDGEEARAVWKRTGEPIPL